jgi:hypothetical protein
LRVTRFVFDVLPHSCAIQFNLRIKAQAGVARLSEQREGWLEAKVDLDPAHLVKGSARRKIVPPSDDFSTQIMNSDRRTQWHGCQ